MKFSTLCATSCSQALIDSRASRTPFPLRVPEMFLTPPPYSVVYNLKAGHTWFSAFPR
jgi:hypothetical protein